MSADYDPDGIPPQWALDMAADEVDLSPAAGYRDPELWPTMGPLFQSHAYLIWRTEEPPVDTMMAVMREAIARYENAETYPGLAMKCQDGENDNSINRALAYLREVGALVDKLP